jgi:hypothetical protein
MNFLDQRVNIPVALLFSVKRFAIGTKIADAFAKGDMDIKAQVLAFLKGQEIIIFVLKRERFEGSGNPRSGDCCS